MSSGHLTIDLGAIVANWRAMSRRAGVPTAAVVKADAYGLGAERVVTALSGAGCRDFFIAMAEEGPAVRRAAGPQARIFVLSGHMTGDKDLVAGADLAPVLNSIGQMTRHFEATPEAPFALQLDTGMNRLGMEWDEWAAVAEIALSQGPELVMSHLACADEPDHPMNAFQLDLFRQMTDGISVPRSLSATGGILLGPDYHFDLVRPGIGLYGGAPHDAAHPVVRLDLPVIQCRDLAPGEIVGYGNSWQATRPSRIATVGGGYADGILRAAGGRLSLWHEGVPCPLAGRISMDTVCVDLTDLGPGAADPRHLSLLCPEQGVDAVALAAGTIGYEILTALGARYTRRATGPSGPG